MEGRWTIKVVEDVWSQGGRMAVVASGPNPGREPVPVVPCDDAAIERVVLALWKSRANMRDWRLEDERKQFTRIAEAVLRAAGETP